jgi:tRNA(Ile)-lysidine synthase TilS/MesJ
VTGPPAATAAVRVAVRRCLADLPPGAPVAAAVSGGADSLALAAALAFERPGSCALVVDHGLQEGSDRVAAAAADQCRSHGLAATVLGPPAPPSLPPGLVGFVGVPGLDLPTKPPKPGAGAGAGAAAGAGGGPEARARELRYALLDDAAGEAVVLLGHTRDDQAETVLLGLLRGSGARALSGMAPVRGRYRRPLLDLPRETVRQACAEAGLTPHEDPHNADPAFTRVAVRRLLAELDVTAGLARSAALLREDADALDVLALPTDDVAALQQMLPALRARAVKRWAEERAGRAVGKAHVDALRALVEDWHGQGPVALPGGGQVTRVAGRLAFTT